jgi:hypothetical protein
MRRFLILMIVLIVPFYNLMSQDDEQNDDVRLANLPIGIGPYLCYGIGTNMTPAPDGRQTGLVMYRLPDAGVNMYMPISSTAYIGLSGDIGFTNYGFNMSNYYTEEEYIHHFSFITFNPAVMFRGFLLGYTLGIPVSADFNDSKIDLSTLNTQHGVTLSYLYPIWGDNDGRISVFGKLTYMFTNVFEDYMEDDPVAEYMTRYEIPLNNSNSPRFASLIIGFTYTFNMFNGQENNPEE